MQISPVVNGLLFALLAVLLAWFSMTSSKRYLFLVGFVLPLMTPGLSLGVNLFWYTLIGPLSLLLLPLSPTRRAGVMGQSELRWLALYVLAVSAIWMCFEYLDLERYRWAESIDLGPGQALYKMPIQLGSFLCQLLAFYVIPTRAHTVDHARAAVGGVVWGCSISLVVGVILAVTTGTGMFAEPGRATFEVGGTLISRVGGLSGEPKMFGAVLVVVLGYLLSSAIGLGRVRQARRQGVAFVVLLVGLFLTYSTSAWLGFAAMMSILVPVLLFQRKRARWAILWILGTIGVTAGSQVPFIPKVLDLRVADRVFNPETRELERSKDYYVIDVYSDKPQHILFGFGMGGLDLEAVPYLLRDPKYAAERQYLRTPTPSVNFMRLLGDLGIVGLALFAWIAWRWSRRLQALGDPMAALFVLSAFVGTMCVSMNAISCFLFLCGAALTSARLSAASAAPIVPRVVSVPSLRYPSSLAAGGLNTRARKS